MHSQRSYRLMKSFSLICLLGSRLSSHGALSWRALAVAGIGMPGGPPEDTGIQRVELVARAARVAMSRNRLAHSVSKARDVGRLPETAACAQASMADVPRGGLSAARRRSAQYHSGLHGEGVGGCGGVHRMSLSLDRHLSGACQCILGIWHGGVVQPDSAFSPSVSIASLGGTSFAFRSRCSAR